ncbi:MFS transporter [Sphingomonas sp.]|uniref:MFS transporter n=1 Tax=Sphingomonas sp. TaxID=28214 RepID=UPI00286A7DEA|nr:MFS transporter [Sphingomonas sp.]
MATLARTQSGNLTRWLVLLLGAAVFLNYVDRGAIAVAAPVMKGELGMSATAFGIAVSAFFWVYAPVQLLVGWLCDRFSVYRLMAGGIVLWAASTLLIGFVGGFASLLVLRVMLGVGESIAFPGTSKIIAMNVPPEQRGMANAAVAAGLALGPAIGTLTGGLIVASLGWRAMFIIFGLATLLWLVPWQRVVRQLPTVAAGGALARVPAGKLLGNWSLWAMGIGHSLGNFCFYFLLAWLPLYLVQSRGYSIGEMTILASIGYGVQAVAAMAYGAISDRWTRSGRSEATIRRAMMIVSQLLAGVAIFGIYRSESVGALLFWLCLGGAATAALSLNLYAIAQMFAGPRAVGTWVGIQNALGNVSGIVGPIITGMMIDQAGYGSAFYLTAGVALIGALWWAFAVPAIRQIAFD